MIRAGMELTVSWTRLFEIVCNRWNDPLQDIEIYDYAGGGVYMIRYDAILNCLQKYA